MRDLPDRPMTYKDRLGFALALCVAAMLVLLSACNLQPAPKKPPMTTQPPPSVVFTAQKLLIGMIGAHYTDIQIAEIAWLPCDDDPLNSYYDADKKRIELCMPMAQYPDAALFYAAHETGHAVTYQLAGTLDEGDADMIGALEMERLGMIRELRAAAVWYRAKTTQIHTRYEEHPGHAFRAWLLECVADGHEQPQSDCGRMLAGLHLYWDTRLRQPQTP